MKEKFNIILALFLQLVLFISCEDNNGDNQMMSRLFSPVSFGASVVGSEVTFSWTPINNASYILDISTDAEFEDDLLTYQIGNVDKFFIDNLLNSTDYYARIKAVKENSPIEDSKYSIIAFKTGIENVFKEVNENDITSNEITISWDQTKSVDKIVVSSVDNPDINIILSEAEITVGKKTVTGLTPSTSYTFKIYLGDRLRGTVVIATTYAGFIPNPYNGAHTAAGSDPYFAVDGNETTYWQSIATSKTYFILDLRKKYNITKIVLKWDGVYFPTTYDIVYSDIPFISLDGSNNLVGTTITNPKPNIAGYGPVVNDIDFSPSFAAQYVAVQMRGRNNSAPYNGTHYRLIEFEVIGVPSAP